MKRPEITIGEFWQIRNEDPDDFRPPSFKLLLAYRDIPVWSKIDLPEQIITGIQAAIDTYYDEVAAGAFMPVDKPNMKLGALAKQYRAMQKH